MKKLPKDRSQSPQSLGSEKNPATTWQDGEGAQHCAPPDSALWLCCAGLFLIGWNIVLLPSLVRPFLAAFSREDSDFGLLLLLSAVLYTMGAMAGGLLVERFGRKPSMGWSVAVYAVALAIVGLGANWYSVIVAAVVASLAMGSLEGGVNGLALDLNRAAQGANLSKVHIFAALGALIGPLFIGQALTMGVSWPWMIACTSVGALMLLAWMLRLPIPDGKHRPASKESVQRSVSNYERRLVPFLALALAINLSVAIEMAVSNWVVRLLSSVSLQQATFVLSLFWTGLLCGRIVSMRLSGRLSSEALLTICGLGATASLAFALLSEVYVLESALFFLVGCFIGPLYPLIMAKGGEFYPHRIASLAGALSAAGISGGVIYPPLMGFVADSIGLRTGMIGAAVLGIPLAACVLVAEFSYRRAVSQV